MASSGNTLKGKGGDDIPASPCAFTDYFNIMAKAKNAPKHTTMKLGACYNLFDCEELLEASIKSVRPEVDYVCVVYQTVSNFGHPCTTTLMPTLERLVKQGLIDDLVLYKPHTFTKTERIQLVSVRATGADLGGVSLDEIGDQFFNELMKREIGRKKCAETGCTHFMSMDADECYLQGQLAHAKRVTLEHDYDGVLCQMQYYFKEPTIRLLPPDTTNYVPVLYKIAAWMPYRLACPYPFLVDPTRKLENLRRLHVFPREELEMHHFSFVRRNVRLKLENTSNRGSLTFPAKLDEFIERFRHWKQGDAPIHPHPVYQTFFKTSERVPNTFQIDITAGS